MFSAFKSGLTTSKGTAITVTEGDFSSTYFGFANDGLFGSYGSVAPTQYLGININGIHMIDAGQDEFEIWLEGNLAQDTFQSARIADGDVFNTASADTFTYSAEYNFTIWRWDTTIPASWDGSGTQRLVFTP